MRRLMWFALIVVAALLYLSLPAIHAAASDSKLLQLVMPAVLAAPRWRTPQLIETDNAGDAEEPRIAVDMAGNAVAVWQQSDGTRTNIWANRYALGSGWGTAQFIETGNDGNAITPQVAVDSAGNAIAVWNYFDGALYHIWANRYTAGGTWGTAQLIDPFSVCLTIRSESSWYPQVAVHPTGNTIAVWNISDGTSLHVCANHYDTNKGWGTAQLIEDNPKTSAFPQAAFDSAGNAIAVWTHCDSTYVNIGAQRYVVGSGWEILPQLIASNSDDAQAPQVAVDSAGNAIAVWYQRDGTYYYHVWANRYVAGSGWGTAQIIDDNAGNAQSPKIAIDSKGNAIAVWQQAEGVLANRYVAGSGWGTAQIISDHSGLAWRPQLAIDPAGNAIAVWSQYASPSGSISHIWANRYVAGSGWGIAKIIDSNNTGGCLFPQVAIDSKGRATAIWQQYDGSRGNIWAARYE